MRGTTCITAALFIGALGLAGCANNGSLGGANVTTQSIPKKAKMDPACVALAAQIESIRQEGTVGRVEKAAVGKSKNVVIKRAALGKVAELNKANAEYKALCSKAGAPGSKTANAKAQKKVASAANAAAKKTAATTAQKATKAAKTQ